MNSSEHFGLCFFLLFFFKESALHNMELYLVSIAEFFMKKQLKKSVSMQMNFIRDEIYLVKEAFEI